MEAAKLEFKTQLATLLAASKTPSVNSTIGMVNLTCKVVESVTSRSKTFAALTGFEKKELAIYGANDVITSLQASGKITAELALECTQLVQTVDLLGSMINDIVAMWNDDGDAADSKKGCFACFSPSPKAVSASPTAVPVETSAAPVSDEASSGAAPVESDAVVVGISNVELAESPVAPVANASSLSSSSAGSSAPVADMAPPVVSAAPITVSLKPVAVSPKPIARA